jgi:peptide-methionine (R)-S-oxide reductase
MHYTRRLFLGGAAALTAGLLGVLTRKPGLPTAQAAETAFAVTHTDAEWHRLLSDEQYAVLRQAGTERPYSSPLNNEHRAGTFTCAGCGQDLYSSSTKFESGTGWPSFYQPLEHAVGKTSDTTFGMLRSAVHCSRCGGHLGHVFNDGPKPTGLRYCMDGIAMHFRPATT